MSAPASAPSRPRWGLRIAAALALLVLATAGIGHLVLGGVGAGVDTVDAFDGLRDRPEGTRGLNFLVAGTDRRDTVTEEQRARYRLGGEPCNCTDALMLVHVSADRDRASVVSIPRDSYVELPPHTNRGLGERLSTHPAKINAAYTHGGPPLTVRAVEELSGVHIDHYIEIDFAAFMKTVDAIGGVDVCTQRPLRDRYSGLDLPAGTSSLSGGEALQYVRARHLDGASDAGRMQRQQRFLAAVVDKITSAGGMLNPLRFREVSSALLGSVRTDGGFGTEAMISLGRAMNDFSPTSSEFMTVPVETFDHEVPGIGSTVKWDEAKAEKIFDRIRADRPLAVKRPRGPRAVPVEVPPGSIQVQVDNGTGRRGLAGRVDDALRRTGFDTTGSPGNALDHARRTVIGYGPGLERSAHALAAALPGAEVRPMAGQGSVLRVTVGEDFARVRTVRPADPVLDGAGVWGGIAATTGDKVLCA